MAEKPELSADHELIVVEIQGQRFALDILSVREIRGWSAATRLPHAPGYVLGIINLRGSVLPVIDSSSRLGLGPTEPSGASVVIVAEAGERVAGLLVEGVCDILTLNEGMLQPIPEVGDARVHDFVRGIVTTETGLVTLLALDSVLPPEELTAA